MTRCLAALSGGCVGEIASHEGATLEIPCKGNCMLMGGNDGTGGVAGGGGTGDNPPPVSACIKGNISPGPTPLRRLSHFEYSNTVRELLGDTSAPGLEFPPDERQYGFDNIAAALKASDVLVERYEATADRMAAKAVGDLPSLLGCDVAARGEDACAKAFIASFGLRAFRRPVGDAQAQRLFAFYTQSRASYDFPSAIRMITMAILQSPGFLYRLEAGITAAGGKVIELDSYSIASRLSYLLWGSMPDQELFRAAGAGELMQASKVAEQARRLIKDDRAAGALKKFHGEWLGIDGLENTDKDLATFPKYSPAVALLLKQETEFFTDDVIRGGDGLLPTLLGSSSSFLNKDLAAFYGISGVTSTTFVKRSLVAAQRAGLLTQGSTLAAHAAANRSSPVARGAFVKSAILCSATPPPPANVPVLAQPSPAATQRQQLAQHRASPACAGCHNLIDPIGLSFEHYDGVGLWRDKEAGKPVDATGALAGTDVDGKVDGAVELAGRLAGSRQVSECVVGHWFQFAHGRGATTADACTLEVLNRNFQASGTNVRELLVALTQTDAFFYRDN